MKSRHREVVKSLEQFTRRLWRFTAHGSRVTAAALAAAACGLDQGEPTLIDRPRILAIKAEPPEIRPVGESMLTTLIALPDDFDADTEPPLLLWGICELTGKVTGQGCTDIESIRPIGGGGLEDPITIRDPNPSVLTDLPVGPANYIVGLFAKVGEVELKAFKRFVVNGAENPNLNPTISELLVNDEPLTEPIVIEPEKKYKLEVRVSEDSAQTYIDLSPTGGGSEKTEELFISWFSSAGGFEKDRSLAPPFENEWKAPGKRPGSGEVRFWIVLHDSREGVDWETFSFSFAP